MDGLHGWTTVPGVAGGVFLHGWCQQCVLSLSAINFKVGEKGIKLVQERGVNGGEGVVALFATT